MGVRVTRQAAAPFLLGLGVALIAAWNLEAWMVGRDLVSTYLAPVGLAVLAASYMLIPARRPQNPD